MAKTGTERKRGHDQRGRDLKRVLVDENAVELDSDGLPAILDADRKARCRASLADFALTYLPAVFSLPMSDGQSADLDTMQTAIEHGGRFAFAAPRGDGKTSRAEAAVLWAALYGLRRCIVIVGADMGAARQIVDSVKQELRTNEMLREDFPVPCWAAAESDDTALRAKGWTWGQGGPKLGMRWDKDQTVLPVLDGADGSGCVLVPRGLTGRLRGMRIKVGRRAVRPDLFVIDDPQTDESATSPSQVVTREKLILGALMGSGGPSKSVAAIMPCTIIQDEDLAARFLDRKRHPDWQGSRRGMVKAWPAAQDTLWKDYREIRREEGAEAATAYYATRRAEMDAGAVMDWSERYELGKELSAVQHAENLLCDLGEEVFRAEYMNDPVSRDNAAAQAVVTPDLIVRRAIGPARGVAPDGTISIVAAADINPGVTSRLGARITWAAAAFQMHQSECVIAYGIHKLDMPKDPTTSQQVSCVYGGLNHLRVMLAGIGCELLIYDARGWYNKGVTRGQALRYGMIPFPSSTCAAIPAEGWAHQKYSPKHKTKIRDFRDRCHEAQDRVEQHNVRWLAWDSDTFNLQQIRAWMAEPGAPGSCIIHSGHHDGEFLRQSTTRAFIGMVQKHSGPEFDWKHTQEAGKEDDYGDCLAMCRVGAVVKGITADGVATQPQRLNARRVRHISI